MNSRERVLSEIRRALRRGSLLPDEKEALVARMHPASADACALVSSHKDRADLVDRFLDKAARLSVTVSRVDGEAAVPFAVAAYLEAQKLPRSVLIAASLKHLAWPSALAVRHANARKEDLVSVTPCFAAIAETGSLVLLSSADSPTTLNFVPEDHVAVLAASQIVERMEDVWAQLRSAGMPIGRTINIISGPSRTADVEQTVQIGVHGPRRVHVILVAA